MHLIDCSDGFRGRLLVATPQIEDSVFMKSLVYICEHNSYGAMGLIINKTATFKVGEIFRKAGIPNNQSNDWEKHQVFFGGPVDVGRGLILHNHDDHWEMSLSIDNDIKITTSKDIFIALAQGSISLPRAMIMLGYASWSPGQLEQELSNNCWLIARASLSILFDVPIQKRYQSIVSDMGIKNIELLSPKVGHG